MYKKILISLATTLIAFSGILSSVTFAAETENNVENLSQEEIDAVAEELQFYFEEVGHLDENGNYIVDDFERLKEKANSGDETAQGLVEQIEYDQQQAENNSTYDINSYANCILTNTFSTQLDLINGNVVNSLLGAIESQAWTTVAEIVLTQIGGSLSKANVVATTSQVAIYAAYCGGQEQT